jgi:predicted transcriptional regulator
MYMQKNHRNRGNKGKNSVESELPAHNGIGTIISGLKKTDQFEVTRKILREIMIASTLDKGVGRNYLRVQMLRNGENLKDYRLRKLLDTLNTLGLIEQGVTKQGSRITELGMEFLETTP